MRKILIVAALPFMLSGCGLFKVREVNKTESSFSQSKALELSTDSSAKKLDKTITIETKIADSVFVTPEVRTKVERPLDWQGIFNGLTLVDSAFRSVTIRVDTVDKKIFAEIVTPPQKLHLIVNERKATYNDKSEESTNKTKLKSKEATEAKNEAKTVISKPKNMFWLWALIGSLVVAGIAAVRYYKFIKSKSPV